MGRVQDGVTVRQEGEEKVRKRGEGDFGGNLAPLHQGNRRAWCMVCGIQFANVELYCQYLLMLCDQLIGI